MFNLIPENLRNKIITDYRLRLVIVVITFLVFFQLVFLVLLFPSWLVSFYKEKDIDRRNDEMNIFLSNLNVGSTTSYVKLLNQKLNIINDSLEYPEFVPIIKNVLSKKTSSIRLGGLLYTVNTPTSGSLVVKGVSDSRESLVSYVKNLESLEMFKKVDLPISNLAKDKNIDFSITISIEK